MNPTDTSVFQPMLMHIHLLPSSGDVSKDTEADGNAHCYDTCSNNGLKATWDGYKFKDFPHNHMVLQ